MRKLYKKKLNFHVTFLAMNESIESIIEESINLNGHDQGVKSVSMKGKEKKNRL
jgi:hypothetical protein